MIGRPPSNTDLLGRDVVRMTILFAISIAAIFIVADLEKSAGWPTGARVLTVAGLMVILFPVSFACGYQITRSAAPGGTDTDGTHGRPSIAPIMRIGSIVCILVAIGMAWVAVADSRYPTPGRYWLGMLACALAVGGVGALLLSRALRRRA